MDPDRWERLQRVFLAASRMPVERRGEYLRRACAGDEELRRRIERMIAHDGEDTERLADPVAEVLGLGGAEAATRSGATTLGDAPASTTESGTQLPESIGPYRILGKLGEGGMGVVFEAEQRSPRRKVALKVVRGGEFVDEARARMFQREVDTLARLEHPDIGAIYESGRTEGGRHYFAMELVRGETLDRFMNKRPASLTPDELHFRLRLFRRIADAVHYAHQRGVIHRDLKPSNIVVTEPATGEEATSSARSSVPRIKILDFGLARITEGDVAAASMLTEVGVIKGTLPYMSPEQTRGDPGAIDVRADVYALGVILYEMLAGTRPYDVSDKSLVEAVRVICEQTAAPLGKTFAGVRRLDPDVETIVGKALEKDADRRYASAAALSEDVERYLTSQPILARPPSTAYQLQKFAARNRALVGGVAATFLVLVAGVVVSTVLALREAAQRREAERARADLESVAAFQASMLSAVDPERMGAWLAEDLRERLEAATRQRGLSESEVAGFLESHDASMRRVNLTNTALDVIDRNILRRSLETLEERFADRPRIDARLRGTIGKTYLELGRLEQSQPQLEASLEARRRLLGDDHPDTLASMQDLARLHVSLDHYDRAEPLLLEVLETRKRVLGDDHPDTLGTMAALAGLYWVAGRLDEAEPLALETLETRRRVLGDDHPDTLASMNLLANVDGFRGRHEEAERLWLDTFEGRKRVLGPDHPDTLGSMMNVAALYAGQGRHDEAEPLLLELLETQRRIYGDEHPRTLGVVYHLANLYAAQGRHGEAEPLYVTSLEANERVYGNDSSYTLAVKGNLAFLYQSQGRYDEAEALYVDALEAQKRAYGDDHWATPMAMYALANLYRIQGRYDEAEPLYVDGLAAQRRVFGADHPETARFLSDLADVYVATARPERARPLVSELLSLRERAAETGTDAGAKNEYARLLLTCEPSDLRDPEAALRHAVEANEITGYQNPSFLHTLSLAHRLTGDTAKAIDILKQAIALLPDGDSPQRVAFERALAELQRATRASEDR